MRSTNACCRVNAAYNIEVYHMFPESPLSPLPNVRNLKAHRKWKYAPVVKGKGLNK